MHIKFIMHSVKMYLQYMKKSFASQQEDNAMNSKTACQKTPNGSVALENPSVLSNTQHYGFDYIVPACVSVQTYKLL